MTYQEAVLGVWSIVEINLGIICCCSMRLKAFVVAYLPWLGFGSSAHTPAPSGTYMTFGGSKKMRAGEDESEHTLRTYQLHSIQKGSAEPGSDNRGHQYGAYDLNVDNERSDGASTDKILV